MDGCDIALTIVDVHVDGFTETEAVPVHLRAQKSDGHIASCRAAKKKRENKSCIFQLHHKRPDEKKKSGIAERAYTEAWKAAVHLVMDFMWE